MGNASVRDLFDHFRRHTYLFLQLSHKFCEMTHMDLVQLFMQGYDFNFSLFYLIVQAGGYSVSHRPDDSET
jgi:hypothetical protein